MRILYVITQADGGGAQKYTLALARHFGGAIAAGNEAGKLFTDAQRAGLQTFELKHLKRQVNPWHDLSAVWEIHNLIKIYNPDIVHLNSTKAGILGSFAAIGTKTKVIFTAHGFVFNEALPKPVKMFYIALEKIASDYRDHIITVSEADKQSALNYKIAAAKKITTVHNGLPKIDFFAKQQARTELGLDENKIIIGNTSNFYRTKGLDILIKAIAKLNDKIKDRYEFVIIGAGPEFENLKLEIGNLRLQNIIKTPGNIPNARLYLKAFDIFVLPSRKEGLPFALLEAMQAGLPIVATNVGGIPEALGDSGILVTAENPQVLAETLSAVILNEQKRTELSQKASERAKLFTEQQMLLETEKIYLNTLAGKR